MRKDWSFLGFWVPTCPNQHGRTLKCRSTVAASAPTKMDTSTSSNVNLPKTFYIWTDEFLIIYVLQNGLHIFHWLLEHFLPLNHHLLQNDYWFFSGQVFGATKWRLVFIIQKSKKKHLLQNDKPGVCNKMHFTSPFFFYQFRVRWHSVVSISSPFLWWKFKGGLFNMFVISCRATDKCPSDHGTRRFTLQPAACLRTHEHTRQAASVCLSFPLLGIVQWKKTTTEDPPDSYTWDASRLSTLFLHASAGGVPPFISSSILSFSSMNSSNPWGHRNRIMNSPKPHAKKATTTRNFERISW